MVFTAPSITDYGAVGDGVTDNAAFIQKAIDDKFAIHGGGIVMAPAGNFYSSQSLLMRGGIRLIGEGRTATLITCGNNDVNTIVFDSTASNASIESMTIAGNPNVNTETNTITIPQNALVHLRDLAVFNGWSALYTQGIDNEYHNCFFSGVNACVVSNGANWYNRCKLDTANNNHLTGYGFFQGTPFAGATSQENHLTMCDFSGDFVRSVLVSGGPGTVTVIEGGVISGPIIIQDARWTCFSACEIGNPIFNCGANPTTIIGCYGFQSIQPSGTQVYKYGNINIS